MLGLAGAMWTNVVETKVNGLSAPEKITFSTMMMEMNKANITAVFSNLYYIVHHDMDFMRWSLCVLKY